jgi:hypothetical protein
LHLGRNIMQKRGRGIYRHSACANKTIGERVVVVLFTANSM